MLKLLEIVNTILYQLQVPKRHKAEYISTRNEWLFSLVHVELILKRFKYIDHWSHVDAIVTNFIQTQFN